MKVKIAYKEAEINEFIKDKKVIDIKFNTKLLKDDYETQMWHSALIMYEEIII